MINQQDPNASGRTLLHHACSSGDLDTVNLCLNGGADLNAQDELGFTPLLVAVSAGKIDVVRALVGGGADVTKGNNKDATPLHYAASKGWVQVRISFGLLSLFQHVSCPLLIMNFFNEQIGDLLIQRGADVNARDKANQLPLHRAASVGSSTFIKLLTTLREDQPKPRLNLADRAGNTPLHLACESGHAQAAAVLIEAGADRQRTNSESLRPEELNEVGDQESRRMRSYIASRCGPLEE